MATSRGGRVTLARALSKLGVASRTVAGEWIAAGRVRVDGRTALDPELWVDPDRSRIEVDGSPVRRASRVWIALHKPCGTVTTRSDELGRPTVFDLLGDDLPYLAPVGRLDLDSSGLLLLTNDSRLAARITSPDGGCVKVYEVSLDAPFGAADVAAFAAGIELDRQRLRGVGSRVDSADPRRVSFTLTEGKNRQIRRMCELRGRNVLTLHRVAIGPVQLAGLGEGEHRRLSAAEVDALERAVARPSKR